MARELAPQGIHVAHFIIDGAIRNPGRTEPPDKPQSMHDPDAIALNYLHVPGSRAAPGHGSWNSGPGSRDSEPDRRFPAFEKDAPSQRAVPVADAMGVTDAWQCIGFRGSNLLRSSDPRPLVLRRSRSEVLSQNVLNFVYSDATLARWSKTWHAW